MMVKFEIAPKYFERRETSATFKMTSYEPDDLLGSGHEVLIVNCGMRLSGEECLLFFNQN